MTNHTPYIFISEESQRIAGQIYHVAKRSSDDHQLLLVKLRQELLQEHLRYMHDPIVVARAKRTIAHLKLQGRV